MTDFPLMIRTPSPSHFLCFLVDGFANTQLKNRSPFDSLLLVVDDGISEGSDGLISDFNEWVTKVDEDTSTLLYNKVLGSC